MSIALFIIAGWFTLSLLLVIAQVGKPRPPLTGGNVALAALFTGTIIGILIFIGIQLL